MDLKKASDKVLEGVLWVCGGNMGKLALSHTVLKYSSKRVINISRPTKLREFLRILWSCSCAREGQNLRLTGVSIWRLQ